MKLVKTEMKVKVENGSSWMVYVCKSYEEAKAVQEIAMSHKTLLKDWYYSVSTCEVLKHCIVPSFFHDRGYWVTVVEHNNGDWNKAPAYELYIVE